MECGGYIDVEARVAGTEYVLKVDPAQQLAVACIQRDSEMVQRLLSGTDVNQPVPVTQIIADFDPPHVEDEVSLVWLAFVSGNYPAVRSLLEAGALPTEIIELVKKVLASAEPTDVEIAQELGKAFEGCGECRWKVTMEELLDGCTPDMLETIKGMGFAPQDTAFSVHPTKSIDAIMLATAAKLVPDVDWTSTAPFDEGSDFCPADAAVLNCIACSGDVATALEERQKAATGNLWVGHCFEAALLRPDDGPFGAVVASAAFGSWAFDGDVPRDLLRLDGTQYESRVHYLLDKWRKMSPTRQHLLAAAVAEGKTKHTGKPSDSMLRDVLGEAAEMFKQASQTVDSSGGGDTLDERFERAVVQARGTKAGDDDKLVLYGLYKQAKEGDCNQPKPGMLDFVGKAKHSAWMKHKGKSAEQAKEEYVAHVERLTGQ
eukprot:Sspe_Gene.20313::Locus_7447_Transcript_2_2_Confidence_0.750_Length_1875::g.20313::m.20313